MIQVYIRIYLTTIYSDGKLLSLNVLSVLPCMVDIAQKYQYWAIIALSDDILFKISFACWEYTILIDIPFPNVN